MIEQVFADADYPQLELHTLAQACFDIVGYSRLGDMLNRGEDPHLAFAANALGITYEQAKKEKKTKRVDDMRQVGKVFNFGKPGGLGHRQRRDGREPTLITFARKTYGVVMTVEQLQGYAVTWEETLPEMRDYFAHVGRLCDNPKKEARVKQLRSHRIRGGCNYTAACNTYFQGLGADVAMSAGAELSFRCYADPDSILFGSRPVGFFHDQFLTEVNDDQYAHDKALEMSRIMRDVANEWVPDCPFKEVEPLLTRVMSKEAEALFDTNGRLVPWEPALGGVIGLGKALQAKAA